MARAKSAHASSAQSSATIGFEARPWLAAMRDTLLPKLLSGELVTSMLQPAAQTTT